MPKLVGIWYYSFTRLSFELIGLLMFPPKFLSKVFAVIFCKHDGLEVAWVSSGGSRVYWSHVTLHAPVCSEREPVGGDHSGSNAG